MKRFNRMVAVFGGFFFVIATVFFISCEGGESSSINPSPAPEPKPIVDVKPIDLSTAKTAGANFAKYYKLDELKFKPSVPAYSLPLESEFISNWDDFSSSSMAKQKKNDVLSHGFAVTDSPFDCCKDDIVKTYNAIKKANIPIFVTTDSLLHMYHIQFDNTLRKIEENSFYDKIWNISKALYDDSIAKYASTDGDLKEAFKRNAEYFAVALELLSPKAEQIQKKCGDDDWSCKEGIDSSFFTPDEAEKYAFIPGDLVKDAVDAEATLIKNHDGFENSPIFLYKDDYSQYVPRGHYNRTEKLKNYFKAMMWCGRMSMLLKGCDDENKCLVSAKDAKIQTIGAELITSALADNKSLQGAWDKIYAVTSFYVGFSDDLGPYQYLDAMKKVFGGKFDPVSSTTDDAVASLKAKLAEYDPPKIFGGTGGDAAAVSVQPPFSPDQADEILDATMGFRLMGQRFVPDSYMFSNLVLTGSYTGKNCDKTFTCENIPTFGKTRAFPRGLDVMALLGSQRAIDVLKSLGDSDYAGEKISYSSQFKKLSDEFEKFKPEEWNKNLYWAWLNALRPFLSKHSVGYPTFMQKDIWLNKELTAALASWSELRHDTILYAKQSYTQPVTSILPPNSQNEKQVFGYVEPVPRFYNRLLAVVKMTSAGLSDMDVLDDFSKESLANLTDVLKRLRDISVKELENESLSNDDYKFIKEFGSKLGATIVGIDSKERRTTMIADVHTDGNTKQVLEEGVGYVKLVLVAYKKPLSDKIFVGVGPVMSYYEFKQPMNKRLTDEQWIELLKSDNPPSEFQWPKIEATAVSKNMLNFLRKNKDNEIKVVPRDKPSIRRIGLDNNGN